MPVPSLATMHEQHRHSPSTATGRDGPAASRILALSVLLATLHASSGLSTLPYRAGSSLTIKTTGPRLSPSRPAPFAPDTQSRTSLAAVALPAGLLSAPLPISICAACLLPTTIGYYRSEYGVSYGYGMAVGISAIILLRHASTPANLPAAAVWHAFALAFYGARLCVFLAYREIKVERFQKMRERIEERAKTRGGRLARTPFIMSCALLYAGLVAPVVLTRICLSGTGVWWNRAVGACVGMTWAGFLFAAFGDTAKSVAKASRRRDGVPEDTPEMLVTEGVFSVVRHPNYTGEAIGWTASAAAAFIAIAARSAAGGPLLPRMTLGGLLMLCGVGVAGINFILANATGGLERRHMEMYGESPKYEKWVKSSWGGFSIGGRGKVTKSEELKEKEEKPKEDFMI